MDLLTVLLIPRNREANIQVMVFWDMKPCNVVHRYQRRNLSLSQGAEDGDNTPPPHSPKLLLVYQNYAAHSKRDCKFLLLRSFPVRRQSVGTITRVCLPQSDSHGQN